MREAVSGSTEREPPLHKPLTKPPDANMTWGNPRLFLQGDLGPGQRLIHSRSQKAPPSIQHGHLHLNRRLKIQI
ncbi:unnamed protein product [Arabis nemorensis]|uniref:Uncharacterized protein n=1 Tax=Arabis nemorensis TaxID=586526 RepID=A0A565ASL0_9BRAS|nr:unnamed protein product [Arabis nemorensis]